MTAARIAYLTLPLILIGAEFGYIALGRRFGLIEARTLRSSHTEENVVRGGGFIFMLSVWLWAACCGSFSWFIGAVSLIGLVSWADDIRPLSDRLRLVVQVVAMAMVCKFFGFSDPWTWVGAIFFGVLMMNAFNFMDGINGMTSCYSAAVVVPLMVPVVMIPALPWMAPALVLPAVLTTIVVFPFLNFRRKPLCFSGDVGAVTLGLIIAAAMLNYTTLTGATNYEMAPMMLVMVALYGVDTARTLLVRLLRGENVRMAHRSHLYQLLANECGTAPRLVSMLFAGLQLAITLGFAALPRPGTAWVWLAGLIACLCTVYVWVRRTIERRS